MKKLIFILLIMSLLAYACDAEAGYISASNLKVVVYAAQGYYFLDELYAQCVGVTFRDYIKPAVSTTAYRQGSSVNSNSFYYDTADINNYHLAFYAGHSGKKGPAWSGFSPNISNYYWGATGKTKWFLNGGCYSLYHSTADPVTRWQHAFHGVHAITGFASQSCPLLWYPSLAPYYLAEYLKAGYTIKNASFYSVYYGVYVHAMSLPGLEPAVLSAKRSNGTRYADLETLYSIYNEQGPIHPTVFTRYWWTMGNPIYP